MISLLPPILALVFLCGAGVLGLCAYLAARRRHYGARAVVLAVACAAAAGFLLYHAVRLFSL